MSTIKHLHLTLAALGLGLLLALLAARPAAAAGVVTDCTNFGPGPGTLATAAATPGLVKFACNGAIVLQDQIALGTDNYVFDATGYKVVLDGNDTYRIFNIGKGGSLWINNLTLMHGNAVGNGGGAIASGGLLTITNSALLSNTASMGGAISMLDGKAYIENTTIAYNNAVGTTADDGGGAIDLFYSQPGWNYYMLLSVRYSTIVGNRSGVVGRGGIWLENGVFVLEDSILANNGGTSCVIAGLVSNNGGFHPSGNLSDDTSCKPTIKADPALLPLGDYGGSTPAFALPPNSPAVDAVGADACAGMTDQRSLLRPRDGNGDNGPACDIGAFEYSTRHAVNAAVPSDGLVGYWKFDEGSGAQVRDSAGSGLTGSLNSAGFNSDTPPVGFGNAFALQGSGAAGMAVADSAALNLPTELTVAAWVKFDDTSSVQQLVAKEPGPGNNHGFALGLNNGFVTAEAWSATGVQYTLATTVTANSWLHVAMTWRQDDTLALYVNGMRMQAVPVAGALTVSNAPLIVTPKGLMDDVRIYSRSLSGGAVAALANGNGCVTAGSTWADAVPDLQCALAASTAGDEVWVAKGRYVPTHGPARVASFTVPAGVAVYGGFAGTETQRSQRTLVGPATILSGDIDGNDTTTVVGGNSYHVVTLLGGAATLDGLTITGGQATGTPTAECGPACGGGIYSTGGSPRLYNISVLGSQATGNGGGLYFNGGSPLLVGVLAGGNQAGERGGGLYAANAALHVVNFTAGGNRAGVKGGGVMAAGGTLDMVNSALGHNSAPADPQMGGEGVSAAARTSIVEGGCPVGFSCSGVQIVDPQFLIPNDPAAAPNNVGNFGLQPASPAIDAGDNNAGVDPYSLSGATISSLASDPVGNHRLLPVKSFNAVVDLGAYEMPNTPPVFTSAPNPKAVVNLPYTYVATVVDPNLPLGEGLLITVTLKANWMTVTTSGHTQAQLSGTPNKNQVGATPIRLTASDLLGAVTTQEFSVITEPFLYRAYLPVLKNKK